MHGFFVHPQGLCESKFVGEGTRVWAFAHVLPGARIGRECNICDGVFIENDVVIGDAVTIKCGVQVWDGVRLGNNVFVGPNATFTNDVFPRSKVYPEAFAQTVVEDNASIGANATILPGVRVGHGAMIGAGAVIIANVPANAVVVGNPGRVVGYAGAPVLSNPSFNDSNRFAVPGMAAQLLKLSGFCDRRGQLVVSEFKDLPFEVRRLFIVRDVPSGQARGDHAHKVCHQLLLAVQGSLMAAVDDGRIRASVKLDRPDIGLYVPPGIWGMQFGHSEDAVLLVLTSRPYDRTDYVMTYEELLGARSEHGPGQ